MNEKSLIPYLIPYMISNGVATYVTSKINEKRIIANFDKIKIGKTTSVKEDITMPKEVEKLVLIIENNIDKNNLNNLYSNLKNVKIKKNFLLLLMGIKGQYSSDKNILSYSINGSIEHEIIHLASAHYDKENNICQSGFINYEKKLTFGRAINEGYTDLIARRLFGKRTMFYNEEVRLTKFIELLFDKKELEGFYFNNDIINLINILGIYFGREGAIKFILSFDRGFELKKQGNPAYKIIYTNLEVKLCELFKQYNKSLLKQIDYLKLLDQAILTSAVYQTKKRYFARN